MLIQKCTLGLLLLSALCASGANRAHEPYADHARINTGSLFHRPSAPVKVQGPSRVDEFVVNGKLRLGLEDAILLTLLNNSDVNVERAQFDLSQFAVQRAHSPFDPLFIAGFTPTRSTLPSAIVAQSAHPRSARSARPPPPDTRSNFRAAPA